jgi:ribonuclease P/MRP protein subunit POP5
VQQPAVRHLPKHLRPRYRYLAVEIETWPDADLDRRDFQDAVWSSARTFLGEATSAAIDLQVIESDFWTGGGSVLVRVRRDTVEQARAALACVSSVSEQPVRVGVRGIGGTVRATESKYRDGPPAATETEPITYRGNPGRAVFRRDRVDIDLDGTFVGATPKEL